MNGPDLRYTALPVSFRPVLLFPFLLWGLCACEPVPIVTRQPVPPPDKLLQADCPRYVSESTRRRGPADPPPPTEQALLDECRDKLVGRVRRIILRCWHDATNAAELRNCNENF